MAAEVDVRRSGQISDPLRNRILDSLLDVGDPGKGGSRMTARFLPRANGPGMRPFAERGKTGGRTNTKEERC